MTEPEGPGRDALPGPSIVTPNTRMSTQSQALIKVENLVRWGKSHGATLGEEVEVYESSEYGISLRVRFHQQNEPPGPETRKMASNTRIASCPFALSLSYLNALNYYPDLLAHSVLLPMALFESLQPHVIGNFFLVQQYLMQGASFWTSYIESLPQPHETEKLCTPIHWPEDDRKWLNGTIMEQGLSERETQWMADFETGRQILDSAVELQSFKGQWTWYLYKWAATVFSSRSFVSTLIPNEVFSVRTNEGSRSMTSEPSPYTRYIDTSRMISDGPYPVLFPLVDLANHSPTASVTWFSNAIDDPKDLSLITGSAIFEGSQIFNNYAPKDNTELLLGYGFILPDNDEVTIAFKHLPNELQPLRQKQSSYLRQKRAQKPENVFHVRTKGFPYLGPGDCPEEFIFYEDGCIDTMSLLVANRREYNLLTESAPTFSTHCDPMARNRLNIVIVLQEKLKQMLDMIILNGKELGKPQTSVQKTAYLFREGQLRTLRTVISPLEKCLEAELSGHGLLSLENAFSLVTDVSLRNKLIEHIRIELKVGDWTEWQKPMKDQDWDEVIDGGWSFVLWCFWIFVLIYVGEYKTGTFFRHETRAWVVNIMNLYNQNRVLADWACWKFKGDDDELEVLESLVKRAVSSLDATAGFTPQWTDIPGNINHVGHKLINIISTIAAEECFRMPVGRKKSEGDEAATGLKKQDVLCVKM